MDHLEGVIVGTLTGCWRVRLTSSMMFETQLPPTLFSIAFMITARMAVNTTWVAIFSSVNISDISPIFPSNS